MNSLTLLDSTLTFVQRFRPGILGEMDFEVDRIRWRKFHDLPVPEAPYSQFQIDLEVEDLDLDEIDLLQMLVCGALVDILVANNCCRNGSTIPSSSDS